MDYTPLPGLGTVERSAAVILYRASATGQPDGPQLGQPDELPWFSFVATSDGFAALEVDWSDERDGTKQVIAPTRVVVPAAAQARSAGLGCYATAFALKDLGWKGVIDDPPALTPDGRLALPVKPELIGSAASGLAAQHVDRLTYEWAAAVAACVVEGSQVAVVYVPALGGPWQRLAMLDAICALLPYAYRARVNLATWASPGVDHTMNLFFTTRPTGRQLRAVVGEPPVTPRTPAGTAYLDELLRLRARRFTTAAVVSHLAAKSDPAHCRDARDALVVLKEIDQAFSVHDDLVADRATVAAVVKVLAGGWGAFPLPVQRRDVFVFLVRAPQPGTEDEALAVAQLRRISDLDEAALWVLEDRRPEDLVERLERGLGRDGVLPLLSAVGRVAAGTPTAEHLQAYRHILHTTALPGAPDLHRPFIDDPAAGVALLTTSDIGFLQHIDGVWCPIAEGVPWLRLFFAIPRGRLADAEVRGLRDLPVDYLVAMFDYAVATHRLTSLDEPFWPGLVAATISESPQLTRLQRSVTAAGAIGPTDARATARIDLLGALANRAMPCMVVAGFALDEGYIAEFSAAVRATNYPAAALGPLVVESLVARAEPERDRLLLLRRLVDDLFPDQRPEAARHIGDYLGRHLEALSAFGLGAAWQPYLPAWLGAVRKLEEACARPDPLAATDAYFEALQAEVPEPTANWHLCNWLGIASGGQILDAWHRIDRASPGRSKALIEAMYDSTDAWVQTIYAEAKAKADEAAANWRKITINLPVGAPQARGDVSAPAPTPATPSPEQPSSGESRNKKWGWWS